MTPWRKERVRKLRGRLKEVEAYRRFFAERGIEEPMNVSESLNTKERETKEELERLDKVVLEYGLNI